MGVVLKDEVGFGLGDKKWDGSVWMMAIFCSIANIIRNLVDINDEVVMKVYNIQC